MGWKFASSYGAGTTDGRGMRYWIVILLFTLVACTKETRVSRYYNFPSEEWQREECCEFEVTLPELGEYDINLAVRHTVDLPYRELWCAVALQSDSCDWYVDTLNVPMMDTLGFWLGRGNSMKTLITPITDSAHLFHSGVVRVRIEHLGEGTIAGIRGVGVELVSDR